MRNESGVTCFDFPNNFPSALSTGYSVYDNEPTGDFSQSDILNKQIVKEEVSLDKVYNVNALCSAFLIVSSIFLGVFFVLLIIPPVAFISKTAAFTGVVGGIITVRYVWSEIPGNKRKS